jgi:ectoine hydroxylase-related dioxygenase (phytanoyl-CoA dioxygenase family)
MSELNEIREKFKENGVALIKNFCSSGNLLELVKKSIEFSLNNPSPFAKTINNGSGDFFYDYWTYKRNKNILELLKSKDLINKIKLISDNKKLNFFHDHILVKSNSAPDTPWHQDRPYYFVDGKKNFSIWITTDYIQENSSLAFCRKSHLSGNEYLPVSFENKKIIGNNSFLKELNDEIIYDEAANGIEIYKMKPGDAIIFNNKTIHKSMPSALDKTRSALSLRFIGDNAFLTKKYVNATPPFDKFGMEIIEGAKPDIKWFPELPLS